MHTYARVQPLFVCPSSHLSSSIQCQTDLIKRTRRALNRRAFIRRRHQHTQRSPSPRLKVHFITGDSINPYFLWPRSHSFLHLHVNLRLSLLTETVYSVWRKWQNLKNFVKYLRFLFLKSRYILNNDDLKKNKVSVKRGRSFIVLFIYLFIYVFCWVGAIILYWKHNLHFCLQYLR